MKQERGGGIDRTASGDKQTSSSPHGHRPVALATGSCCLVRNEHLSYSCVVSCHPLLFFSALAAPFSSCAEAKRFRLYID